MNENDQINETGRLIRQLKSELRQAKRDGDEQRIREIESFLDDLYNECD